jgi:hypothetical protein
MQSWFMAMIFRSIAPLKILLPGITTPESFSIFWLQEK